MAGCSSASSSSLLSQRNISGCFLLKEIFDTGTRYHEGLKVKYGIDKMQIEELDKIAEYSLSDLAKTVAINSNEANHWHHK